MKITNKTTFKEILFAASIKSDPAAMLEYFAEYMTLDKEQIFSNVPENLNGLTWAELITISAITSSEELINKSAEMILNLNQEQIMKSSAVKVFSFIKFIKSELERIADLFKNIKYEPTSEEKQAGIDRLNFGLFGTLDWWAKRMGIADHAEAEKTPWIRIYQCMKNDSETAAFQKRLSNVLNRKKK